MDKKDLIDLIKDDDLGLLDIEKKSLSVTPDDRLSESFMEINEFFSVHNAEPKTGGDIHEHKLASRLKHIRENKEQRDFLTKYDTHGLLKIEKKGLDTVSDIFEDDELDLLSIEDSSVFDIKNVPQRKVANAADFVARRKPCSDFSKFEPVFNEMRNLLHEKKKVIIPFEDRKQIKKGTFFVLGGLVGLVQNIGNLSKNEQRKFNSRLRIIFENGTESNMFLRSLVDSLHTSQGRIIVDLEYNNEIEDGDLETGYIYVLKSLSESPRITTTKNLFKIGFSSTNVEERIKNAEQDPTYLMAPVSVVATYRCFNMNPQRFERLIHRFFSDSCLDLEITDRDGRNYIPKEWFIAPITAIGKAIELIIKGEIVNYYYDKSTESIMKIK
ncbi:MAG: GIY-YIG nuclease family protein [Patescibacteria group bacterium]